MHRIKEQMFQFQHFKDLGEEGLSLGLREGIGRSFAELNKDPWYHLGGAQRLRAMTKFSRVDGAWKRLEDQSFYQSAGINRYNGGVQRTFNPIDETCVPESFLFSLAQRQSRLFGIEEGDWQLNVHQIRIQTTCGSEAEGLSTPEGIHRDGHDFIAMMLWKRTNVRGAASRIYDLDLNLLEERTLEHRGEGVLLNDRQCMHAVTPFYPEDPSDVATRDVFIFDWNQRNA